MNSSRKRIKWFYPLYVLLLLPSLPLELWEFFMWRKTNAGHPSIRSELKYLFTTRWAYLVDQYEDRFDFQGRDL